MVKIVLMNVDQASHALVPSRIYVTTGNGHKVSSIVKVSLTKFSYGHERQLYIFTQLPTILGPENYNKNILCSMFFVLFCFFFNSRDCCYSNHRSTGNARASSLQEVFSEF